MDQNLKNPFQDKNGNIYFPYQATLDRIFIYPSPPPETYVNGGNIVIPQFVREEYAEGKGILLSIGPGFQNEKGKWIPLPEGLKPGLVVLFDRTVPWRQYIKGPDGKYHIVVLCGIMDILGVLEDNV